MMSLDSCKNQYFSANQKKSNIVPAFRRTPDEPGLVQGPAHDEIELVHPGVSFTSPSSRVPNIYIY